MQLMVMDCILKNSQYGEFYVMYILQLKKKFEGIPLQSSGYDLGLSLQGAGLDPWLVN